jgi:hypothetical protein
VLFATGAITKEERRARPIMTRGSQPSCVLRLTMEKLRAAEIFREPKMLGEKSHKKSNAGLSDRRHQEKG